MFSYVSFITRDGIYTSFHALTATTNHGTPTKSIIGSYISPKQMEICIYSVAFKGYKDVEKCDAAYRKTPVKYIKIYVCYSMLP